jgi:hypothetical protein
MALEPWDVEGQLAGLLEARHLLHQLGTAVEEPKKLVVHCVNGRPQGIEVHGLGASPLCPLPTAKAPFPLLGQGQGETSKGDSDTGRAPG